MRKIFSISLLIIYLALLIVPYVPYIRYYVSSNNFDNSKCSVSINSSKATIGDICYLNALIDRTRSDDDSGKTTAPPPSPNTDTNNMVYLYQGIFIFPKNPDNIKVNFKEYTISIKEIFLEIPVPPPNLFS